MAPKRLEIRAQTGFKSGLKSTLGPLAELLELSWQPGGLLEASWNALGALLEAFGAQKSNWKRLLDGPRPPRRSVSACLGTEWAPKTNPRRVPNRGPKAIRAENGKTLIFNDLCKDSNDFSGARGLFGGPKVGPKWGPNRIFDAEALRKRLGSLLGKACAVC